MTGSGAELSHTLNVVNSVEQGVANPYRQWGKDSKVCMSP